MLCGVLAFAQNRVVTGKVTNTDGSPVAGASVRLRGAPTGVAADGNGAFSIKVKDGDILEISGTNYETQRISIRSNTSVVDVQLKATTTTINEVVVTALGIKRQAKELGYATTTIKTAELNQAKVTNIATGLAAKVSGLQINLVNNSVGNNNTRVTLRGNRSILGNNQALLVVDDVQLPISYIGTLNPNDVDNVTVLKGASASALYGSDASNGVIIITTKKGQKGKPVIRVSSTASFETVSYMPELQNEFGPYGGEQDAAHGGGSPGVIYFPEQPYYPYVPYENQDFGPRYNGQKVPLGAPIRVFRNDGSYFIIQDSTLYAAKPNAKKNFFDKGTTFTNDVSYSAGDDKSKFFFSFQDVNQKGILPKDVSRRDGIRANGSKENGIFRVDYNVGYTFTHNNTTPGSSALNAPFASTAGNGGAYTGGGSYFQNRPVYFIVIQQPAMVDLRDYRNWQNNPYANPNGFYNAYYGNPWWQIDQTRMDEQNNDLIGNFALTVTPASWLNVTYRAGLVRNDYSNKYTKAGFTFAPWAIADTLGSGRGTIPSLPGEGDATSYSQKLSSDLLATIHKTHKNFDYKLTVGTSMQEVKNRILSTSAAVLVIPDFYNISNRVGEPTVSENFTKTRRVGVFGDLEVGYKNWLFLHGSLRNDWTSLLSPANRSYLYPAADLSFVFTDAIKGLSNSVLSYGKLRGAYSKTAQVSVGPYSLLNTFNAGGGFPFGGVAGFTVNGRFANPDIKPEFSTDKEVGIELGFLKNRVLLSGAYYTTNTTNQTIPITISSATGFTSAVVNSGVMNNEGIEVDLKVSPIVKTRSGFRWDIGGNFSYNKNVVKSIAPGLNEVFVGGNAYAIVGQPYPVLKGDDWLRDPQGHIIVDKITGQPSLNPTPAIFGTTNPPRKIGLNTTLTYKGFTFSAVADGRFGAVVLNAQGEDLDFSGVSKYSTLSGRQPFVIPHSVYWDGAKYVPNTNINTASGNVDFWAGFWNTAESNYVNSADFWKIREFSFGYNIPRRALKGYIKEVSMQITGRNFFTKKAKENMWSDPEFSNTTGNGIGTNDIGILPPTKFFAFSLNLTF